MKHNRHPGNPGISCLNPLQEVGVMKLGKTTLLKEFCGLNPLQEVGVMKRSTTLGPGSYLVLIPFRKSG